MPRDLVLGTAGHIDHGKTALVRALTGVDTDRLPEEKARGISIDLGFAELDLGDVDLAIVDVPGHERFVRSMLAGATGFDLGLLVVAADDSVMPQTREHLEILDLLHLAGGVVALTKCDLAEKRWIDLVEDEVRALTAGTVLDGCPIVRTSAATGEGLDELRAVLRRVAAAVPFRGDPGPFRMSVDRVFSIAGHGTVVTGAVASGLVRVGDELHCWPGPRAVRVRGLQRHGRSTESLARGARAAINLAGVHHSELARGCELATPGYLSGSRVLSVELRAGGDRNRGPRHRARYRLHLGTADVRAALSLLTTPAEAADGRCLAQLHLATPVVAVHGQPFILRAESPPATVGGGRILQATARRLRKRDTAAIQRIEASSSGREQERLNAALSLIGSASWTPLDLCRETGIAEREIAGTVETLMAAGEMVELPVGSRRSVRLTSEVVSELEDRVLRAMRRLHTAHPRNSTVRREHLSAAFADLPSDALLNAVVDRLRQRSLIVGERNTLALAGHEPTLSQNERRVKSELREAIIRGGFSPPDRAELMKLAGPRSAAVADLLAILVAEGELVEVGDGIFLSADHDAELRARVSEHLAANESMTMAELRDLLKTTRRFAVPIGEYLDRRGLTKRDGDVRRLAVQSQSSPIS